MRRELLQSTVLLKPVFFAKEILQVGSPLSPSSPTQQWNVSVSTAPPLFPPHHVRPCSPGEEQRLGCQLQSLSHTNHNLESTGDTGWTSQVYFTAYRKQLSSGVLCRFVFAECTPTRGPQAVSSHTRGRGLQRWGSP